MMVILDAMMTYDRSIGTREAFVQEAGSFVPGIIFGPAGRILVSDPRGADTTRALRQAAVRLKKENPQARSAGSIRASQQKATLGS